MKKLILALFACLSLALITSCTTEDIDDSSTILGGWTLTSWKIDTPIDLNNDGSPQSEFSPGCLSDSELNFMDATNGTIVFSSDVAYNTKMEDGKLVFMTACSTDSDRVPTLLNYTINGSSVMIDFEGETYILTIEGNTLSMIVPNGFVAKDIDTFETTVMQDITYTFTR